MRQEIPKFGLVPLAEWTVKSSTSRSQRDRILGTTTFKSIVARVVQEAKLTSFKLEKMKEKSGFVRFDAVITVLDPATIDLWHNSRGGCRAQYYIRPSLGEASELYVIANLSRLIQQACKANVVWAKYPQALVEASVLDRHSKIRIYPGVWIHRPRLRDRKLVVRRWAKHWQARGKNWTKRQRYTRKLARRASLIPSQETRFLLKTGWVHRISLKSLGRRARNKEMRPIEIHEFGFN